MVCPNSPHRLLRVRSILTCVEIPSGSRLICLYTRPSSLGQRTRRVLYKVRHALSPAPSHPTFRFRWQQRLLRIFHGKAGLDLAAHHLHPPSAS